MELDFTLMPPVHPSKTGYIHFVINNTRSTMMQVNTTPVPLNVDESRRLPKIGEYAYVKVTMGGETVSRRCSCEYVGEYDSQGHLIHEKMLSGGEVWHEYNDDGDCIYEKQIKKASDFFTYPIL